jgi:enamine deaminase RidA (YjgF/YER057c/UK114 family)
MRRYGLVAPTLLAASLTVTLAEAAEPVSEYPKIVPAPHGAVILPTERDKQNYDEYRFAAARRVDDALYISGVIIGRRDGEGNDAAAFKLQVRRGFERLKTTLAASGASFADVVMINSFHVWQGPNFVGSRDEQFAVFEQVVDEFIKPPYPAWTAVGTTGLLSDQGIVEVQLIARVPSKQAR